MRRLWWLALIAVIAAAVVLWSGPPALRPPAPEGPEDPYVPRELPAGVQGRLVVWDHPWPHANPVADPSRFQGEYPETWARRLEAAVEAFRRRFPQVEVVVDVRPFAPGTERPAAGEDRPHRSLEPARPMWLPCGGAGPCRRWRTWCPSTGT